MMMTIVYKTVMVFHDLASVSPQFQTPIQYFSHSHSSSSDKAMTSHAQATPRFSSDRHDP